MEELPSARAWVVVPTYNEADNVRALVPAILEAVPSARVLVVDDGSPDGTAGIVRELAAADDRVRLLARTAKTGLGSAYREGFKVALAEGATSVVEMDADFSHDPADIPRLLDALDQGAALAIGSRYVRGGSSPGLSTGRLLLSRGGNLYASVMLGLGVHDATAGFRAYRAEVISEVGFRSARADGYGFQVELTRLVHDAGHRIVEVPIVFRDRRAGTSKMSTKIVVEAMVLCTIWGVGRRVPWLDATRQERLIDRFGAVVDWGQRAWASRR